MKITQIIPMPDNSLWQGAVLGLGDDGIVYILSTENKGWNILIEPIVL